MKYSDFMSSAIFGELINHRKRQAELAFHYLKVALWHLLVNKVSV